MYFFQKFQKKFQNLVLKSGKGVGFWSFLRENIFWVVTAQLANIEFLTSKLPP